MVSEIQGERVLSETVFTDLRDIDDASRCNNSHGNVAARMNSINANKDTFKMYTDMF